MRRVLLLFCAGIASAVFIDTVAVALLPVWLSFGALILLIYRARRLRFSPFLCKALLGLCFFTGGLLWHLSWADRLLQQRLPAELEGVTLVVEGIVLNLPQRSALAQQFEFKISKSEAGLAGRKVLLNFYGDEVIAPGQLWQFSLRLNRPHGFSNPGGFDYEGWLFQKGISAKGYVRNSARNELLMEFASLSLSGLLLRPLLRPLLLINHWRYQLKSRIVRLLADSPYLGMVLALTLGDKSAISQADWQLFSATGSNHLFVISGLHIGMISGCCYWLALLLQRKIPSLTSAYPAQKVAALLALLTALAYALLAGFTLPTQRALVMIAVFMLGSLNNRHYLLSFRFVMALTVVLLLNPLAFISSGFWLSFAAVGALLLAGSFTAEPRDEPLLHFSLREKLSKIIKYLIKPQLVVFLALSLPLIFWTQQLSLISPIVNMLAIPVVGFLVVPLCFLALLFSVLNEPLSEILFSVVESILTLLIGLMRYFLEQGADALVLSLPRFSNWQLLSLVFAVLILLLPKEMIRRFLLIPLCLPIILPLVSAWLPLTSSTSQQKAAEAELRVHIVDVGQGLAVIVETPEQVLVYDTGANLSADFNIGSAVLVPLLRSWGITTVDRVIISHGDNDHAGGLSGLESKLQIGRLLSNGAELNTTMEVGLCAANQPWRWHLVEFQFLQTRLDYASENNNSCVLQIRFGATSILLPGDIEREAETELVLRYGEQLNSTILLAPHHGSASSSSYAFVKNVRPKYVVFSAGYRNNFNHPDEKVVARYREFGSIPLSTTNTGMISFEFDGHTDEIRALDAPRLHREENFRYWH